MVCTRHATVHGDALIAVRLHVLIPGIQFSVGTVSSVIEKLLLCFTVWHPGRNGTTLLTVSMLVRLVMVEANYIQRGWCPTGERGEVS